RRSSACDPILLTERPLMANLAEDLLCAKKASAKKRIKGVESPGQNPSLQLFKRPRQRDLRTGDPHCLDRHRALNCERLGRLSPDSATSAGANDAADCPRQHKTGRKTPLLPERGGESRADDGRLQPLLPLAQRVARDRRCRERGNFYLVSDFGRRLRGCPLGRAAGAQQIGSCKERLSSRRDRHAPPGKLRATSRQ